jgi:hypothetical protein
VTPPTSTPTRTPITPEHIGYRVRCVHCNRPGEIDEVTPGGAVIVRHDALAWCFVRAEQVQPLESWHATPPRPGP